MECYVMRMQNQVKSNQTELDGDGVVELSEHFFEGVVDHLQRRLRHHSSAHVLQKPLHMRVRKRQRIRFCTLNIQVNRSIQYNAQHNTTQHPTNEMESE